MKRIVLMSLLFLFLIVLTGCVYRGNYPVDSDYYVSGAYQRGGTYISAGYWNYPGYGYGFSRPICGYNSSGRPLFCTGPVAPSYWQDIWRVPAYSPPYLPLYWRR